MTRYFTLFPKLKGFILFFSFVFLYQAVMAQNAGSVDWSEKIQLYGHGFSVPVQFTEAEFEYIANTFDVFTIEKRHAYNSFGGSPSTERSTIATAAKLKAINPDIKVLLYWNAVMSYDGLYESNAEFTAHPEWVHSRWPTGYDIYDLGNIDCQDWWVNSIVKVIRDGDLDGVFLDAGPKVDVSGLTDAYNTAVDRLRDSIGHDKIVIYNGYRVSAPTTIQAGQKMSDHHSGVFIEFFLHSPLDTKEEAALLYDNLTDAYNDGKMIFPRGTPNSYLPGTALEDRFQFSFASFLLFYGPKTYWIYNDGYNKTDGMFDYYPEYYDKATGQSLGSPQRNDWVYTREFENASVRVDLLNLTSSIRWVENPKHEDPLDPDLVNISVTVRDADTNDSITLASLSINDENYTSNFVGEMQLNFHEDDYPFTLSKEGYDTLRGTFNVRSDTSIILMLKVIPEYSLGCKITDDASKVNLSDALLTIDGKDYTTNNVGEVDMKLYEGEYPYNLSKAGYISISDTLNLTKDTLVHFEMDKESYILEFKVKNETGDGDIEGASISINDSLYVTDMQGELTMVLDHGVYDYSISKEGYDDNSSMLVLSKDTLLTILLSLQTGVNDLVLNERTIYPNPVDDVLMIDIANAALARYKIYTVAGKLVLNGNVGLGKNRIDVDHLLSGVYFVQVLEEGKITCTKILKIRK